MDQLVFPIRPSLKLWYRTQASFLTVVEINVILKLKLCFVSCTVLEEMISIKFSTKLYLLD